MSVFLALVVELQKRYRYTFSPEEKSTKGLEKRRILERVCHKQRSGNFSWSLTSRRGVALCSGGSSHSTASIADNNS